MTFFDIEIWIEFFYKIFQCVHVGCSPSLSYMTKQIHITLIINIITYLIYKFDWIVLTGNARNDNFYIHDGNTGFVFSAVDLEYKLLKKKKPILIVLNLTFNLIFIKVRCIMLHPMCSDKHICCILLESLRNLFEIEHQTHLAKFFSDCTIRFEEYPDCQTALWDLYQRNMQIFRK